jgi:hypothetical protein
VRSDGREEGGVVEGKGGEVEELELMLNMGLECLLDSREWSE